MAAAVAAYYVCAQHHVKYGGKKRRHNSILSGYQWFNEIYDGCDQGSDTRFYRAMGFSQSVFDKLFGTLVANCGLSDSRYVTAEERLTIFCHFLRTGKSSREMQERFQRSGWTITKSVLLYAFFCSC